MRRDLAAITLAAMCFAILATGCGPKPKPSEEKPMELDITGPMDPTPMPTPMPMPPVTPAPEPGPAPKDPGAGAIEPAPSKPEPKPLEIPPPAEPGQAAARPFEKSAVAEIIAKLGGPDERDAAISELKARGPVVVTDLTAALAAAKPDQQVPIVFALGALGKDAAPALPALKQLAAGPEGSPVRDTAAFAVAAIEAK